MTTVPRLLSTLAAALAAAAVLPGAAAHAAPRTVDLRAVKGLQIVGAHAGDGAGLAGAAGDVNGDRRADILIGADQASTATRRHAGAVYVVFGRARATARRAVVRAGAAAQGFRIVGPEAMAFLGRAVAAGDLNGDGLGDLLVSAVGADHERGAAWVVFGKRDGHTVDLRHLGAQGFRIRLGGERSLGFGVGLDAGRDVNGDGVPDLVLAPYTGARPSADAYVVFGGTVAAGGDLVVPAGLPGHGYVIHGAKLQVRLAGDMNGDGRAEVVAAGPAGGQDAKEVASVTWGKADDAPVDLANLGAGGFQVVDDAATGGAGGQLASADVDGDGLGDLIVGASFGVTRKDGGLVMRQGRVSVVFGAAAVGPVSVTAPSPRLWSIALPLPADPRIGLIDGTFHGFPPDGTRVAAAGDVDGDGFADLGFTGPDSPRGRKHAGSVWIVRGRAAGGGTTALAGMGRRDAVRIDGAYAYDSIGAPPQWVGDFDGDGGPDLVLGSVSAGRDGRKGAGVTWVIPAVTP